MEKEQEDIQSPWQVIRDTAILGGVGTLFVVLKPLRAVVLARTLGPYSYGLLNIPLPYAQLVSIFANMGISAALLRLVSIKLGRNRPAEARALERSGLGLALGTSMFWALALSLAGPALAEKFASEPRAARLIALGAWMVPGLTIYTVLGNLYLARNRGPLLGMVRSIYSLLSLVLPLLLVLLIPEPMPALAGFVAAELAGAAVSYLYFRTLVSPTGPARVRPAPVRPILRVAHGFFYTNLGWMLINSVDRIMIQAFCPTEILGFYAVAVFFVGFLNIIPMTFSQVITPSLTKAQARDERDRAWQVLGRAAKAVSLLLAPALVFAAVFSGELVRFLFSSSFAPAALFLATLAPISLLNYMAKLSWALIVSHRDPGWRSLAYLGSALVNVVLNLALIPRYGGEGAALASLASFLVLALSLQGILRAEAGRFLPLRPLLAPFLVALVSFPIHHYTTRPLGAFAALTICSLAYLVLCPLLGVVSKSEAEQMLSQAGGLPSPARVPLQGGLSLLKFLAR